MGKNTNVNNKHEKIAEWTAKGVEWCANQLWLARKNCERLNAEQRLTRFRWNENAWKVHELEEVNDLLKHLLEEEGVKVRELIVTYKDKGCSNEYCDDDMWECGRDCEFYYDYEKTETFKFYAWDITDGYLTGITKRLKEVEMDVVNVIDADTMTVIYGGVNE